MAAQGHPVHTRVAAPGVCAGAVHCHQHRAKALPCLCITTQTTAVLCQGHCCGAVRSWPEHLAVLQELLLVAWAGHCVSIRWRKRRGSGHSHQPLWTPTRRTHEQKGREKSIEIWRLHTTPCTGPKPMQTCLSRTHTPPNKFSAAINVSAAKI